VLQIKMDIIMKTIGIFLFNLIFTLLLNLSCNSVEPPDKGNGQDTTSHNFTWQTWTFGEHSSSSLYDVAILNDTSIWAVGEIYMNDSLGQSDPNAYNAIHWNGKDWKLKRVKTNACGGVDYPPIQAILAFSLNDVLFAHIDGSISHYNGLEFTNDCSLITQLNGAANKMWGKSNNDFYVVSSNGFIAHYQNGNWTRIITGTNLDFYDIWGDYNSTTSEYEIICVASDLFLNQGKKILKIENNIVSVVPDAGLSNSLHTVWFAPGKKYFIGGDGLFSTSSFSESWIRHTELPSYYKDAIRGNSLNDIIVAGAFGLLLHYNGNSWKNFQDITYINGELGRVDMKGNVVCAVGYDDNKAIVILGKRE
jgi:hypothetical protein